MLESVRVVDNGWNTYPALAKESLGIHAVCLERPALDIVDPFIRQASFHRKSRIMRMCSDVLPCDFPVYPEQVRMHLFHPLVAVCRVHERIEPGLMHKRHRVSDIADLQVEFRRGLWR